jgi:hypothetical protein
MSTTPREVSQQTLADVVEEAELIESLAAFARMLKPGDTLLEMEARNFGRSLRAELRAARAAIGNAVYEASVALERGELRLVTVGNEGVDAVPLSVEPRTVIEGGKAIYYGPCRDCGRQCRASAMGRFAKKCVGCLTGIEELADELLDRVRER